MGSFVFFNIGTAELVFIIFVALLLFGPDKLPSLAKNVGKGMRELNRAKDEVKQTINEEINKVGSDIKDVKEQIDKGKNEIEKQIKQDFKDINK